MLTIKKPYAVKHLNNGAGRVYISGSDIIAATGFTANCRLHAVFKNHTITVTPVSKANSDKDGFKLLNTGRGLILELRNLGVGAALKGFGKALVSATKGKLTVIPHPTEQRRIQREKIFTDKIAKGKSLSTGSLFSGLGLLNYYLSQGFAFGGIKTHPKFANDICSTALAINAEANPVWKSATGATELITGDIREIMQTTTLPKVDILDISYPCNGQSTLIKKDMRDTQHPLVGDLFVDVIGAIRAMNPALLVIECTPAYINSDSLRLKKQALPDYEFHSFQLKAADHGEIETRNRVAVIGISKGIRHLLNGLQVKPQKNRPTPVLSDFLTNIEMNSPLWRKYEHVTNKVHDERLDFTHNIHTPSDNRIATIIATYANAKIGSPFLAHPNNPELLRMFTVEEHAKIKRVPPEITNAVLSIENGTTNNTTQRGSTSTAHKLLGMSVNRYVWEDVGASIAQRLLLQQSDDLFSIAA